MEKEVTLFHKGSINVYFSQLIKSDAELPTALLKENLKFVRVEWTDNGIYLFNNTFGVHNSF
jgi:hypothetical protein